MAGKKESNTPWRQISIVIRADILEQARQQKIDVSEACNRTLAERLGIDFRQQKIPDGIVLEPVIIAANGKPVLPDPVSPEPGVLAVPAIINADDPKAAKALKSQHPAKSKTCTGRTGTCPSAASCYRKKRSYPSVHPL